MDDANIRIELLNADYLNIVELNTTGDNENYVKGDSESKYMQSEVFNLFIKCFENSNSLYEFYGATKYNLRKIVPLKNELTKKLETLQSISSLTELKNHIKNIFLGEEFLEKLYATDANWEENWRKYFNKLCEVNKGLIAITDKCIDEQRILWVIGY